MRLAAQKRADGAASGLVPNRPTPAGRELGAEMARLADTAIAEMQERFPGSPERCPVMRLSRRYGAQWLPTKAELNRRSRRHPQTEEAALSRQDSSA